MSKERIIHDWNYQKEQLRLFGDDEDFKDLYKNEGTFKRIVLGKTYTTVGNIPQKSQIRIII